MFLLKPSLIEGVGVFTDAPIKKGKKAEVGGLDYHRVADEDVPKRLTTLFDHFGVYHGGYYEVPLDFHRMSVAWYLNHSRTPNLRSNTSGTVFRATRDIAAGEELTIDYRDLSDTYDNSEGL